MDRRMHSSRNADPPQPSSDRILRFRRSERRVHWALAIPFLLCYASALVLVVYYNPDPQRPYRDVVSWIHRLSGIGLVLLPLWAAVEARGDYRVHFYNIRQAWIWSLQDVRWLVLMGLAAVSRRTRLPEQGKFNAAEKLNFMMLMSTYPLYILTGLTIWFTDGAFLAWVVHVGMAILATPLITGHLFMATLNPGTRKGLQGMISGFVDRQWAKHHYRRWYRESFEGKARREGSVKTPKRSVTAPKGTVAASASCDSCRLGYPIESLEVLVETIVRGVPLLCPRCHVEMKRISSTVEPEAFHQFLLCLQEQSSPAPTQSPSTRTHESPV